MTPNDTILKFKYPETLIKEYNYWVVLVRPAQVTAGSLILACKEDAEAMADVSKPAFTELSIVMNELEIGLKNTFQFDKINYLCLMMLDKQVHFHVIPRYANERIFDNISFKDNGWPKLPQLMETTELTDIQFQKLVEHLRGHWI
ncbi:MAG: HIT family protein [Candidatus Kariarchaeaceae archaeon]|jgi:diadenosine tetraphosphate (Ap4A) HIT family hydrolase